MDREIKIVTVRVGDLHLGDVIRWTHPLDHGSEARKSHWLQLQAEPRLTEQGKVVLELSNIEAKVFPSAYELVDLQVQTKATPPAVEIEILSHNDEGLQYFLMEGHWRRTAEGKVYWIEPNIYDPEIAAEEITRQLEERGTFEGLGYAIEVDETEVPYCDYCEKEGHYFRSCPARDDAPGEEEAV